MSMLVESAVEAVVMEVEEQGWATVGPPLVVDKELVARLVCEAQRQGLEAAGEGGFDGATDQAGPGVGAGGRAHGPPGLMGSTNWSRVTG